VLQASGDRRSEAGQCVTRPRHGDDLERDSAIFVADRGERFFASFGEDRQRVVP
jgi:hypothetical protein